MPAISASRTRSPSGVRRTVDRGRRDFDRPSALGVSMRLTIVGSGDAFGSGGRFNTCFQVGSATATVLIDCGASSPVALRARGIDPNDLDGVILSHLHGDHFGGLPFLLIDAQ